MITSKIYLRKHRDDDEMVELIRTTIRKLGKRVHTSDSVFAVMHIDLFEDDILLSLNDEEADPDDCVEVEFKLIGSPPKRHDGEDDGYGDYLYDQKKDREAEERSK